VFILDSKLGNYSPVYNQTLFRCSWCGELKLNSEKELFHKVPYCHLCAGMVDKPKNLKKLVKGDYKEIVGQ